MQPSSATCALFPHPRSYYPCFFINLVKGDDESLGWEASMSLSKFFLMFLVNINKRETMSLFSMGSKYEFMFSVFLIFLVGIKNLHFFVNLHIIVGAIFLVYFLKMFYVLIFFRYVSSIWVVMTKFYIIGSCKHSALSWAQ